ncbi:MAG: SDR family NAD(P)-dependent oxidoreductase [Myxococcales bacterium]|nr:SDR family NAD(P)-dependent oxidoreductase [Myxococcales bacterium]
MARVALLTGATGAIGRAIARGLGREPGVELVLVVRDRARGERLVGELAADGLTARLEVADLSRKAAVRELAERWEGPLHVLVNNAAVAPRAREETPEGIERQLATNVLGYLWTTELLRPALRLGARDAGEARVVNVASYWAGDLALDDLEFRRRRYDNDSAYRQSKQANRMLTLVHADMLAPDHVSVNACHPGDVNSTLSNALGFGGSESPERGADTPVWLAASADLRGVTGGYFERRAAVRCRFASDRASVAELYRRSLEY